MGESPPTRSLASDWNATHEPSAEIDGSPELSSPAVSRLTAPPATVYWEEQELGRKYRRLGLRHYYRADAFVYHRWRKGGGEHDSSAVTTRYFEEGMRLYYAQSYGRVGAATYDLLGLFRVLAGASRALARAGSRPAS